MKKTLYLETTKVPARRTAAEITEELIAAGATSIHTQYEEGRIVGLRWVMKVQGVDTGFAMPARVDEVYNLLCAKWRGRGNGPDRAQSERIAWRQLLRWVQVQLAMIQCGLAHTDEVFFAYIVGRSGQTMFEHFREHGGVKGLLEAPKQ